MATGKLTLILERDPNGGSRATASGWVWINGQSSDDPPHFSLVDTSTTIETVSLDLPKGRHWVSGMVLAMLGANGKGGFRIRVGGVISREQWPYDIGSAAAKPFPFGSWVTVA